MKYFVIFLILASLVIIIPQSFSECISLPCDDANIKLGEPNYRFIDFSYANTFDDSITFILERIGYGNCTPFIAEIIGEDGNLVWGEGSFALCDPNENPNLITSQIKIGFNENNPIIINKSGKYLIKVQIDDGSIQREFVVRQNHSGASLDPTVYPVPWMIQPPLKQIKSGIPFNEIKCNDNLVLLQKHDGSPACVTEQTKQKLIEREWTAKDYSILKTSINCMTLEQSKETAPFFKTPTYLPEGYFHVCSQSGTPFESYIVYHNQEIPYWNIPELVSDGAIFIYQIDEKNIVGEEKFETLGTAEQQIQETYDGVMKANPSLQPQLIRINGILAYAVDSCPDCGIQTANFTDGTFIQKSTSTETKIKFIDENGTSYLLKAGIPLSELIKVAESLQ